MGIPTKGDEFAKLIEHLRRAQESSAMLAHLYADESPLTSKGWLGIEELMKRTVNGVTKLATKGLH